MRPDPAALRLEASAYRELATEIGGVSMSDALLQTALALDALALQAEAEAAKLDRAPN